MFQGNELLHVGVSVVNALLHVTMVDLVTSVFCDDDLRALPSVPCLCHGGCCEVRTWTSRVTDNSKQVDPSMTAVDNKHKECATIPHFERQPHLDGSLFLSWRIQHTQQVVPSTRDTDFLHRCSIMICVKCPGRIILKLLSFSPSRREICIDCWCQDAYIV